METQNTTIEKASKLFLSMEVKNINIAQVASTEGVPKCIIYENAVCRGGYHINNHKMHNNFYR